MASSKSDELLPEVAKTPLKDDQKKLRAVAAQKVFEAPLETADVNMESPDIIAISPEVAVTSPESGTTSPASKEVSFNQRRVTVIKIEKITPSNSQKLSDNSDVLCVGTFVESAIDIDDSTDAEIPLIASLQAQDDEDNPFLQEINQVSQPLQEEIDKINRLRKFEPLSLRHLQQDRRHFENLTPSTSKEIDSSNITHRPGPKSKKNILRSNVEYMDDSESPGKDFHRPTPPAEAEILNDDFSVFLSSQLMCVEGEKCAAVPAEELPFTYVKPAVMKAHKETSLITTCFLVQLVRVVYEKNVKFELHVNLPQYSLYEIIINKDSVQSLLNINNIEFRSIMNLLEVVESYHFNLADKKRGQVGSSGVSFITNQLDLFFSTQIRFKTFNLIVNGENFECVDGSLTSSNKNDLTFAIDSNILRKMRNK